MNDVGLELLFGMLFFFAVLGMSAFCGLVVASIGAVRGVLYGVAIHLVEWIGQQVNKHDSR